MNDTDHRAARTACSTETIQVQLQDGGGDRSDRGRAEAQSDLASEGCACTPGGATHLSDPKPFHE